MRPAGQPGRWLPQPGVHDDGENDPRQQSRARVFAIDEDFGYRVHADSIAFGMGDHPDLLDPDLIEDRQDADHEAVRQVLVGLEVDRTRTAGEDRAELIRQQLDVDRFVAEKDDLIGGQGQDDRFVASGEGGSVLFRQVDLEALDQHRCGDDEDDQAGPASRPPAE